MDFLLDGPEPASDVVRRTFDAEIKSAIWQAATHMERYMMIKDTPASDKTSPDFARDLQEQVNTAGVRLYGRNGEDTRGIRGKEELRDFYQLYFEEEHAKFGQFYIKRKDGIAVAQLGNESNPRQFLKTTYLIDYVENIPGGRPLSEINKSDLQEQAAGS